MNTEQERAEFEAWWDGLPASMQSLLTYEVATQAYELGRSALQSQDNVHKHPHPQRNDCHCVRCKPLERPCGCSGCLQSQDREDAPFLQEEDQHALHRFIETAGDGEGYDIGKDRIKRLADLGVVSNQGFGRYSVTMFGYWCHERHWHQNPSLPLKTIDEHNAQAAIDHARRVEGGGE